MKSWMLAPLALVSVTFSPSARPKPGGSPAVQEQALVPFLTFVKGFPWRRSDFARSTIPLRSRNPVLAAPAEHLVTVEYPDSQLPAGRPLPPAQARFLELGPCRLQVIPWPRLQGKAFSASDWDRTEDSQNLTAVLGADVKADQVIRYRQTGYDRSSGNILVRAVLRLKTGAAGLRRRTVYLKSSGASSSDLDRIKDLIPDYESMRTPQTAIQVSMGNFIDHYGFFLLRPKRWSGWGFIGPTDEAWESVTYRGLVEMRDGRHRIGEIRLEGNTQDRSIDRVFFRPPGEDETLLRPSDVRFLLSLYAFGWGETLGPEASEPEQGRTMASNYDARSDLRHLFAFPYLDGDLVFYDQISASRERLEAAKNDQTVDLALRKRTGEPLSPAQAEMILAPLGYRRVARREDVHDRGDYFLGQEAIRVILRSSRYPINGLAIDLQGRLALTHISGASGRVGANYWTIYRWVADQIEAKFGWRPFTLLVFDNGMDPHWNFYKDGKVTDNPVRGGRTHGNGSLVVEPPRSLRASS